MNSIRISLISTCLNEMKHLERWLAALESQTRFPDELVLVDAGSRDGTWERLQEWARTAPFPTRLFQVPGANISQGRNWAITRATRDHLVSTDLGCAPAPFWLEQLTLAWETTPELDGVFGPSMLSGSDPFRRAFATVAIPRISAMEAPGAIPSARCLGHTREAWAKAGGYPEWLTRCGEDTFFGLQLRRNQAVLQFVPEAAVAWCIEASWFAIVARFFDYGLGDGEADQRNLEYQRDRGVLTGIGIATACFALGAEFAATGSRGWVISAGAWAISGFLFLQCGRRLKHYQQPLGPIPFRTRTRLHAMTGLKLVARNLGFAAGSLRRNRVRIRKKSVTQGPALFVLMSAAPWGNAGGGQRPARIARELLARGFSVLYLHLDPQDGWDSPASRLEHPRFSEIALPEFDFAELARRAGAGESIVGWVFAPTEEFAAAGLALQRAGAHLIYDRMDDWSSCLGGDWFDPACEAGLAAGADLLLASSQLLREQLVRISGDREVQLVPNAVDLGEFGASHYPRPFDFQPVDAPPYPSTVIYAGHLRGEWLDWELLTQVALKLPHVQFLMLGSPPAQTPGPLPESVRFLGLKSHSELAAYYSHAAAGIIPFRLSPMIQAVSPLKAFEYLASHLPVITSDLIELHGIEGVAIAAGSEEFAQCIAAALRSGRLRPEVRRAHQQAHSWGARLDGILDRCGVPLGLRAEAGA